METPEIEIAVLKSQYDDIKKALREIKSAVTDLISIKSDVSSQGQLQRTHEEKISHIMRKVEEIDKVNQEQNNFNARLQGGFKLATVCIGVIQAILISVGGWVATTMLTNKDDLTRLKQTVMYLEQQNADLTRLLVEKAK